MAQTRILPVLEVRVLSPGGGRPGSLRRLEGRVLPASSSSWGSGFLGCDCIAPGSASLK